jgi:hypothetical protein
MSMTLAVFVAALSLVISLSRYAGPFQRCASVHTKRGVQSILAYRGSAEEPPERADFIWVAGLGCRLPLDAPYIFFKILRLDLFGPTFLNL